MLTLNDRARLLADLSLAGWGGLFERDREAWRREVLRLNQGSTFPVFEDPTSETHWTCPQAPDPGMTHHMTFPANTCRFCRRSASALRAQQRSIMEGRA